MAGEVEVPQFISSVHKLSKQFGFSFALIRVPTAQGKQGKL